MLRLRFHGATLWVLGIGISLALLPGCSSSRSLARALKISPVDHHLDSAKQTSNELASSDRSPSEESEEEQVDEQARSTDEIEHDAVRQETDTEESVRAVPEKKREREPTVIALSDREDVASENRHPRRPEAAARKNSADAVETQKDTVTVLLTTYQNDLSELDDVALVEPLPPSPAHGQDLPTSTRRLQVPSELPGSEVESLHVPPFDPKQSLAERRESIQKLYANLPELPASVEVDLSQPEWLLRELEEIAWENHPALMRAAADVEVARGNMIQAGLYPNPSFGWEQDTIGPGIQGYKGPYMSQEIITGGKLKLSRSAAAMAFETAQVMYQRTRIEIATTVRQSYYDLLVAQQRRRMLVALSNFTDEIYLAQIELVAGGQAAPYEPLQLRVFCVQARNAVIDAHNRTIAAGRRLGAATNMIDVEEFHIAGNAEQAPERVDYGSSKAYLLENHTDLRAFRNQIVQSQYLSQLECIKPRRPNIQFYGTYQHAYGVPPFVNSYNFQVGAPIPIFDRNQGNILAAESSIVSNERAYAATKNLLTGQLAEILARFDTARIQAVNYRQHVLPDQVRTYRGVYSRYREGGQAANDNLNFSDVIVAQQTLSTTVGGYADVLSQMWQAYVDAANVLQVEDLELLQAWFGMGT